MSATKYLHIGEKSWWDGHYKALCGSRFTEADVASVTKHSPWCPKCLTRFRRS